ncbi:hypothetical protein [Paraburkholderia sp. SIMBA_030]|uniref:hypothetical protein n=1 Tax=Paraburkholderia sp. SIMBA_030 TaxID=3085773 RepID=UPI00397D7FD1
MDITGKPSFDELENGSYLNWPDGRLCFEATSYLQEQIASGNATIVRGGTVRLKAYNVSHLVRFCYQTKTDFIDMSDAKFTMFANSVRNESKVPGNLNSGLLRDGSVPRNICRDALEFLFHVGKLHNRPKFVSVNGIIKAEKVVRTAMGPDGRARSFVCWEHEALPAPGIVRSRGAISDKNIKRLTAAVSDVVGNASFPIYRKRRLHVILRLSRILGCRRTELLMLRVKDFKDAWQMAQPLLSLVTLKQGRPASRTVEINHVEINEILSFVKIFRSVVVKETCGSHMDDGFLLVSATSGRQLEPNTVTQLMRDLRNAAGISEQACVHMLRGNFIVERLTALMEKHNAMNKDDFRRMMINKAVMLKEVMKETGQTSMDTILHYLDAAEAKLADLQKTKQSVRVDMLGESLKVCAEQHKLRMGEGTPEVVSLRIYQASVEAARQDATVFADDQ